MNARPCNAAGAASLRRLDDLGVLRADARVAAVLAQRFPNCDGACEAGRSQCQCSTAAPAPAEACTEIGADDGAPITGLDAARVWFGISLPPFLPSSASLLSLDDQTMNAATKTEAAAVMTGLQRMRQPVPDHLVSKKPQGTKAQNECPPDQKRNCGICGGWHHPSVKHLDYVGHAVTTHLMLDADEKWDWQPLAFTEEGLPRFDANGGLWIKLTVDGVTRLGYGNADKKNFGDAGAREKEVIGDALRNAAMRFGLALDLWSKADLHAASERDQWFFRCIDAIRGAKNVGALKTAAQAAIAEAKARGDQDAEDEFLIEQAEKMAKATPKPKAPTPPPPPASRDPLDDDDLPY